MTIERDFQKQLIKDLENIFPGCYILKNDPDHMQGIPDILILYKDRWAFLECKKTETSKRQPNQEYYIQELNKMSYAAFVYPENKKEVLRELQRTFKSDR